MRYESAQVDRCVIFGFNDDATLMDGCVVFRVDRLQDYLFRRTSEIAFENVARIRVNYFEA